MCLTGSMRATNGGTLGVTWEGPEGVKWELGFFVFWTGKMGFTALGLGINHWERDTFFRQFQKWEWDFCSLVVI